MRASIMHGIGTFVLATVTFVAAEYDDPLLNNPDYNEKGEKIYFGDVILTPGDEEKFKNSKVAFTTEGQVWPRYFGPPVVPYYVHHSEEVRDLVKKAVEHYKEKTCIQWVEVPVTDRRHKVRFMNGLGCYSNVGKLPQLYPSQDISIGPGCEHFHTVVHEMGHALGLHHTHQGSDRDDYVVIDIDNVESGKEHNFYKKASSLTLDLPYDLLSIMHYKFTAFSNNGTPTMISKNIDAQHLMGQNKEGLAFTDAKALNLAYGCTAQWLSKCPYIVCENGGYIGRFCDCVCPRDKTGERCQEDNGPFYPPNMECGGNVTEAGMITSPEMNPASTPKTRDCSWYIKAPHCKRPVLRITKNLLIDAGCKVNQLTIRNEDLYSGTTYCSQEQLPENTVVHGPKQEMVLHFYSRPQPDHMRYGFQALVSFEHDPNCETK